MANPILEFIADELKGNARRLSRSATAGVGTGIGAGSGVIVAGKAT